MSTFFGLVVLACLGFVGLRIAISILVGDIPELSAQLADLASHAAAQEQHLCAQNSLDSNLDLLREILYGYVEPRPDGDNLYFGDRLINGGFEAVDQVKARFGGTATVFFGDERIATNVQSANGTRAIGTRLAPGQARDTVWGKGRLFLEKPKFSNSRTLRFLSRLSPTAG